MDFFLRVAILYFAIAIIEIIRDNKFSYTLNEVKFTEPILEPKNIFILDEGARNNVIVQLRNFYNTIDFEFWMTIADRPVDINLYLAQLQQIFQNGLNEYNSNANEKITNFD